MAGGMDVLAVPLIQLIHTIIDLYIWVIVIGIVMSWLVAFNVINQSNKFVYMVGDFVYRITEPALGRVRRMMPDLGGIDISPVVLILGLMAVQHMLRLLASKI